MHADDITQMILAGLPSSRVTVDGDDGVHFSAIVISDAFEGKNRLARHRLVYGCLGDKMQQEIHALSISAYTPSEAPKT